VSDVENVLSGYARIRSACRARDTVDATTGVRVSRHQANLLAHLDAVDPSMVSELAEHVGVTVSTMSLTLKRLEATGLVRRERDPTDRRVTNVRLTEAGVRLRDARSVLDRGRVEGMLRMLEPERRREALRGLALLAEAAERFLARGGMQQESLTSVEDT
jgi:DNA-binding MarR family transcriptional regulator